MRIPVDVRICTNIKYRPKRRYSRERARGRSICINYSILVILMLSPDLHYRETRIEADHVRKCDRAHGMTNANFHRSINIFLRHDSLVQGHDSLVDHGHENAVHDEARCVLQTYCWNFFHSASERQSCLHGRVRGCQATNDLEAFHHRNRVHEMHSNDFVGPFRHACQFGD